MTWKRLLDNNQVQPLKASKEGISKFLKLVDRDLADAALESLSSDRRFATAYNAALALCRAMVAATGYRITSKTGHHKATLEAALLAFGKRAEPFIEYFDTCRRKRNLLDYDLSDICTESEVADLLEKVVEFKGFVLDWLAKEHPNFMK